MKIVLITKFILAVAIVLGLYFGVYYSGMIHERTTWVERTAKLQAQVNEQEKQAEVSANKIRSQYAIKITQLHKDLGNTRTELSAVRVLSNSCSSQTTTTGEADRVTDTNTKVVGTPAITEAEYERINKARFEENRIKAEALQSWVDSLYRSYPN